MGFLDFFKPLTRKKTQTWNEFGKYSSRFSAFGNDIYASECVRSCIRPLAEFSSKAEAKCKDKEIENILNTRPNVYMNGKDFLYKVRTMLEIQNSVFIYISRDDRGKASGFYPVPWRSFEALEYNNGLFIKFYFNSLAVSDLTLPWADLAVVRKDYNKSDIAGDPNDAILNTLEMLHTTDEGLANSIKATANLRGIIKSTKGMLSPEDVRKQKDDFVRDYLNLENAGGIASLDATQEFIPISMNPATASHEQMQGFREDIQRYFGVNDDIIMSKMNSEQLEIFYEARIEPFLVRLSTELTSKAFNKRELGFGNYIVYESNKLQFCSLDKKIQLFKDVVLYGGMTINEWRVGCNMAPVDGGDERIMRLDAQQVEGDSDNGEN